MFHGLQQLIKAENVEQQVGLYCGDSIYRQSNVETGNSFFTLVNRLVFYIRLKYIVSLINSKSVDAIK